METPIGNQSGIFKFRLGDLTEVDESQAISNASNILDEVNKPEEPKPASTIEAGTQSVESAKTLPSTNEESISYYNTYMYLVSIGKLPKYEAVTIGEEQVPIEEYLTSREALDALLKTVETEERAEKDTNSVDLSILSPVMRAVIETMVNGGDVKAALRAYDVANDTMAQIDLSTEEGLQLAVVAYYRSKGLQDDAIVAMIKGYMAEGKLESEGRICYEKLNAENEQTIIAKQQAAIKAKNDEVERLKQVKAEMRNKLRDSGMSESKARVVVEKYLAPLPNQQAGFYIDSIYAQRLDDPEYGADLILFLDNKEEYIKTKSAELVNKTKLDVVKGVVAGTEGGGRSLNLTMAKPNVYNKPKPEALPENPTPDQGTNSTTIKVQL